MAIDNVGLLLEFFRISIQFIRAQKFLLSINAMPEKMYGPFDCRFQFVECHAREMHSAFDCIPNHCFSSVQRKTNLIVGKRRNNCADLLDKIVGHSSV